MNIVDFQQVYKRDCKKAPVETGACFATRVMAFDLNRVP
jgi:hypothetical protein